MLELPCVTAFIIRVIAAERSDAGAEGAVDTLDGAIGVVEMELENKGMVEIDLVFALVVYYYECNNFVVEECED